MDALQQSYSYGSSPLTSSSRSTLYHAYLVGGNISQSLSPLLHTILFNAIETKWSFHLAQTTDASQFTAMLTAGDTIGTSITMPNKVAFLPCLDALTEEASVIGAVNTSFVRIAPGGRPRYIGTNTDCVGLRETILQKEPGAGVVAQGRPAMVVGGGGAARSAIYSLWKWFQPSEIYIANRLESEVEEIVRDFTKAMPGIQLRHIPTVEMSKQISAPHIVIGAVPDYPPQEPGEILCSNICDAILQRDEKGLLVDMCYMPSPQTRLLKGADGQGWKTITGAEVLLRECVAQQILWAETEPSEMGARQALAAISKKTMTPVSNM